MEEGETRNEQIEADTDRGIKREPEKQGRRKGVCAMGWMLHSTRTVLAVSWLPRCPGGERLNTSGLLLLPPLCTLSSFAQRATHLTPFDRMEWVNAIDSRAQGAWVEAAPTAATV
ncbi:hypothetical protein K0M31_002034 [Melipona bicolor]|uniref:Uncharacterized protein n=1 Tax=Melipona bicolor TaxID=60889 RepID=A0AA40GHG0_9HYME|nr:hypothetical protein K0M31_002034 [Melipona bicolor]